MPDAGHLVMLEHPETVTDRSRICWYASERYRPRRADPLTWIGMEAAHNGPATGTAAPGTVTLALAVESPEEMQELGRRLAGLLAPATW